MEPLTLSLIDQLESEAIHIIREVASEFERPVMMYSIGRESSVMRHLASKAVAPGAIPCPLLHVDTSYKLPEMTSFRNRIALQSGLDLRVHYSRQKGDHSINPWDLGTVRCCASLKTQGLLDALKEGRYDAVLGGARREEERSRAKERIFSFRDAHGYWDPRRQRP